MAKVTGTGCAATAVTGAFLAVTPDRFEACAGAMAVMGICGELAAKNCAGPGSFQVAFIDALYNLKRGDIAQMLRAQ
jgi:hydroxyethylthiazole kinase